MITTHFLSDSDYSALQVEGRAVCSVVKYWEAPGPPPRRALLLLKCRWTPPGKRRSLGRPWSRSVISRWWTLRTGRSPAARTSSWSCWPCGTLSCSPCTRRFLWKAVWMPRRNRSRSLSRHHPVSLRSICFVGYQASVRRSRNWSIAEEWGSVTH